ncbi:uncharacterized protein L203_100403 [Cryptococcus depauperatus CBS 7841]|uniref:Uncharacterized protein n=1 Tax=Cryptococcus depauperatus CBS 7841 TaxID=1295531 RepID=A0A1E3HY17_9TREE|nr:E3 ubiquitin-protein ligase UBR7 [Cryptococcus depauperatus CBS 7841]
MASSSSSSRLTLLPSNYLASQAPSSEITLQSLIDVSDRMADEAREALPYKFNECSYERGYLRQSVWACLDCEEKGICYGCSISCHGEHHLVELWTKRSFRCDCPTSSMQPETQDGLKRRRCSLNPPETQPMVCNKKNRYSKNFKGKFCRCGRDYDAEVETEAMIYCIACEDWLHESCLNLRQHHPEDPSPSAFCNAIQPSKENHPPTPLTASNFAGTLTSEEVADEDIDEESNVLIATDTYDGLICADCVNSNSFLQAQAGKKGWMIIEPVEEGWTVVGKSDLDEDSSDLEVFKRPLNVEESSFSKKLKLDSGSLKVDGNHWRWKGKGDIFLAHGIRENLQTQLDATAIESLPFPLQDEEIYEPPREEEEDETVEQATSRVVSSLPRIQAIEALHGYQRLKERLNEMLRGHVQSGQTVKKEDIEELFEQLKSKQT